MHPPEVDLSDAYVWKEIINDELVSPQPEAGDFDIPTVTPEDTEANVTSNPTMDATVNATAAEENVPK